MHLAGEADHRSLHESKSPSQVVCESVHLAGEADHRVLHESKSPSQVVCWSVHLAAATAGDESKEQRGERLVDLLAHDGSSVR